MISTLDSESIDRGLNPRGTFIYYSVFDAVWLSVSDYLHGVMPLHQPPLLIAAAR
jgi:hypothetical protein